MTESDARHHVMLSIQTLYALFDRFEVRVFPITIKGCHLQFYYGRHVLLYSNMFLSRCIGGLKGPGYLSIGSRDYWSTLEAIELIIQGLTLALYEVRVL